VEDPEKLLEARTKQKMYLARYGRVSPFEWEDRDLGELRGHFEALVDLIKAEAGTMRNPEDL
jgi:hypothetical protein